MHVLLVSASLARKTVSTSPKPTFGGDSAIPDYRHPFITADAYATATAGQDKPSESIVIAVLPAVQQRLAQLGRQYKLPEDSLNLAVLPVIPRIVRNGLSNAESDSAHFNAYLARSVRQYVLYHRLEIAVGQKFSSMQLKLYAFYYRARRALWQETERKPTLTEILDRMSPTVDAYQARLAEGVRRRRGGGIKPTTRQPVAERHPHQQRVFRIKLKARVQSLLDQIRSVLRIKTEHINDIAAPATQFDGTTHGAPIIPYWKRFTPAEQAYLIRRSITGNFIRILITADTAAQNSEDIIDAVAKSLHCDPNAARKRLKSALRKATYYIVKADQADVYKPITAKGFTQRWQWIMRLRSLPPQIQARMLASLSMDQAWRIIHQDELLTEVVDPIQTRRQNYPHGSKITNSTYERGLNALKPALSEQRDVATLPFEARTALSLLPASTVETLIAPLNPKQQTAIRKVLEPGGRNDQGTQAIAATKTQRQAIYRQASAGMDRLNSGDLERALETTYQKPKKIRNAV